MQGRADEERRIGQELQRIGDDFMLIMLGVSSCQSEPPEMKNTGRL